jgi:hypothetical protein
MAVAVPQRARWASATAMAVTYTITRLASGERQRCEEAGDDTQPCNSEGASYLVHRSDGKLRTLCCNHAARLAAAHRIRFPVIPAT